MTNEEILEGNKLIAEFMGYKIWYRDGIEMCVEASPEKMQNIIDWARYHSSWDWLMPVNKKLREKLMSGLIPTIVNMDKFFTLNNALCKSDIDTAFTEIVGIIKWYNQNNQSNG